MSGRNKRGEAGVLRLTLQAMKTSEELCTTQRDTKGSEGSGAGLVNVN